MFPTTLVYHLRSQRCTLPSLQYLWAGVFLVSTPMAVDGSEALVFAGKPNETRAAHEFADGFGVSPADISHLDDSTSLKGVIHVVVNMHNGGSNGTEPVVIGYDPSGKVRTEYTAVQLAKRLRERGFDGTKITLAICYSGSVQGKGDPFAQGIANDLGVEVIGYDHYVGTPDPAFSHPVTRARVAGGIVIIKTPGSPVSFKPTLPPESDTPQPGSVGGSAPSQVAGNPPLPPLPNLPRLRWFDEE